MRNRHPRKSRPKNRKNFVHYLILAFVGIVMLIYITPIYWILATSLKAPADIHTKLPKFIFQISLENYQKLIDAAAVPGVTYLFIAEAVGGLLLFAFFSLVRHNAENRQHGIVDTLSKQARHIGLAWNGIFVLTCLYSFFSLPPLQTRLQADVRFQFWSLIVCCLVTYGLILPSSLGVLWKRKEPTDTGKLRFAFVGPTLFATIAVCIVLANNGSAYFYQLFNSVIIAGGSTILAVGLGTLSAYAFSRFNIAGKDDLLFFILSTRMLPPVVVVIPIYLMYSALGLRDTHFGLILLYTTFNVSFAVWLMKGFIDEIPTEYEDAALVDGYTRFQTFLRVVLPQSVTGMAATAVFCLITAWNEFAFAIVLTEVGGRAATAPPSITSATGSTGMDWGKIAAATFVFLLPVAIFTFLMRSHLLRGVTFGAIKK